MYFQNISKGCSQSVLILILENADMNNPNDMTATNPFCLNPTSIFSAIKYVRYAETNVKLIVSMELWLILLIHQTVNIPKIIPTITPPANTDNP